ncbi:putative glucose receptor Git3 [Pseudohyphozyma bogoriensis]|nr:putative glucose receptor Git3 [Pseudohyphozyma bogoriensis]
MGIPDVVISALSFLGGTGMVIGYYISPTQKMRQKMVMGLGAVDAFQGLVIMVGGSYGLTGREIQGAGCDASSFLYQATVVVSAAWTLGIAVVTYITLIHPMSRLTALLDHRFAVPVIWTLVWLIGVIPAAFGAGFFHSSDTGYGICWYDASSGLGAKLMIFVPRAVVLVIIIALYCRLFIFFRRRDVGLLQESESHGQTTQQEETMNRLSVTNVTKRLSAWRPTFGNGNGNGTQTSNPSTPSPPVGSPETDGASPTTPYPPAFSSPRLQSDSDEEIAPQRPVFVSLPSNPAPAPPQQMAHFDEENSPDLPDEPFTSPRPPAKRMSMGVSVLEHQSFQHRQSIAPTTPNMPKRLSPRQINRRTSVLMMLYPLAYLVLFSVSVARLAVQIATTKPAHPVLTDVSRWLVYAGGLVDGVLFVVIEWAFRRSVRGRT